MARRSSNLSHPSADVNVRLWDIEEYQECGGTFPPFVDPEWITGQLAMTTISIGKDKTKVWATIDLLKVRVLHTTADLNTNLYTVITSCTTVFDVLSL
jgi:hypothetical protein